MKKFFSTLVLLSLLGAVLVPMIASAQATGCSIKHDFTSNSITCAIGPCTFGTTGSDDTPINCSRCCFLDLVYTITDWLFFITLSLAVVFILVGGFKFITASGSPEKAMEARSYLIYAAIGVLVALLAKALPAIVRSIAGLT
jgi:hypothetical protein